VVVGLGVAATAIGLDAGDAMGCVRGGTCQSGFVAAVIPAGVVMLLGVVLIFDAGGELSVQEMRRLPTRDHHDAD
jgi:hypothetical protein